MKKRKTGRFLSAVTAIILTVSLMVPMATCKVNADTITESYSKYAATGDSITEGYGLDGLTDDDAFNNSPSDCYAQRVARYLNAELVNLGRSGKTPKEYINILNDETRNTVDVQALGDADLITICFGQVDVIDYVLWGHFVDGLETILKLPANRSVRSDFESKVVEAITKNDISVDKFNEIIDSTEFNSEDDKAHCKKCIKAVVDTVDEIEGSWISLLGGYSAIKQKLVKNGIEEEDIAAMEALFEYENLNTAYSRAYADFTENIGPCIEKIRSMNNNNAQIVLVGYYDPAKKTMLTESYSLADGFDFLGAPFENATTLSAAYTEKMNTYLESLSSTDTPYVDITGISGSSYEHTFHPDADAHAHIAEQVEEMLFHEVTVSCGSGGTAEIDGEKTVKYNGSCRINIQANSDYVLDSIKVNGKSQDTAQVVDNVLTLTGITTDTAVNVTFRSTSSGGGGGGGGYVPAYIQLADSMIAAIPDQIYTGSPIEPAITVRNGGTQLTKGTDYTVSYGVNTEVGTGTVTVTGKGSYTGTAKATFQIVKGSPTEKEITDDMVGEIRKQPFSGKAVTPGVSVKDGEKTLVEGTDYEISYSNNDAIGYATADVKGIGEYAGTVNREFQVVPETVKLKSVSKGNRKFTAKWSKASKTARKYITGYRVEYSTKKDFSSNVNKKNVNSPTASSITVSKLKKKTIYYVRLCCFKTIKVNGKAKCISSEWSNVQKVRTK